MYHRKKKTSSGNASLKAAAAAAAAIENNPIVKTDKDVLRGRASHEYKDHHPGNVYLHELVSEKYDEYHDPNHPGNAWFHQEKELLCNNYSHPDHTNEEIRDHDRKNRISRAIVEEIRGQGGRFLTRNKKDQPWQQVKNPVTIVSQTFRDYKEKKRRRHRKTVMLDKPPDSQQHKRSQPAANIHSTTTLRSKKRTREDVKTMRKRPNMTDKNAVMDDGAEAVMALMSLGRLHDAAAAAATAAMDSDPSSGE